MHPDYAWIEVRDNGGPWKEPGHRDDRAHGLGIMRELAADWGIDGDALTGWIVWARLEWCPFTGPMVAMPPGGPARTARTGPAL